MEIGEFCTVDEMMIRYKGIYCPLWQYMWHALDVGHKNLVFGLLNYEVYMEFCNLLW